MRPYLPLFLLTTLVAITLRADTPATKPVLKNHPRQGDRADRRHAAGHGAN